MSEYITDRNGRYRPDQSADNIIEGEFQEMYPGRSGNKRRKGPGDWIKTADDKGFSCMSNDKFLGFSEIFFLEKEIFPIFRNEIMSISPSEPISEKIPENRSEGRSYQDASQIQDTELRKESSKDNYGMSRDKRSEKRRSLQNRHEKNDPISPMVQYGSRKSLDGAYYRHDSIEV